MNPLKAHWNLTTARCPTSVWHFLALTGKLQATRPIRKLGLKDNKLRMHPRLQRWLNRLILLSLVLGKLQLGFGPSGMAGQPEAQNIALRWRRFFTWGETQVKSSQTLGSVVWVRWKTNLCPVMVEVREIDGTCAKSELGLAFCSSASWLGAEMEVSAVIVIGCNAGSSTNQELECLESKQ